MAIEFLKQLFWLNGNSGNQKGGGRVISSNMASIIWN